MKKNFTIVLGAIWFMVSLGYTINSAMHDDNTKTVGINLIDISLFGSMITLGLIAVLLERSKNLKNNF